MTNHLARLAGDEVLTSVYVPQTEMPYAPNLSK